MCDSTVADLEGVHSYPFLERNDFIFIGKFMKNQVKC